MAADAKICNNCSRAKTWLTTDKLPHTGQQE